MIRAARVGLAFLTFFFLPPWQAAFTVSLTAPQSGQALQGQVAITGNTDVDGFLRYRVEFNSILDTTGTWFLIYENEQPVRNDVLAEWDTTRLSDGEYNIQLVVELDGADPEIREATFVRIRNYTPIETNTPAPTQTPHPGQTATPTSTQLPPTATALPTNPAEVSTSDWQSSIIWGVGIGLFLFIGLILYTRSRR